MKQRAIIFDLDGTLADSIPVLIEIINDFNLIERQLTRGDYEKVKNFTVKAAAKEFKIPLWRVPKLLVKGRVALSKRINEVPFFAGMDKAIGRLAKNHRLFVMSSNSLVNVRMFLELHGIQDSFEETYGGVGIFGKAKMLRKILKDHGLQAGDVYYVGDEARDIEAAKKAGVKSIAVTWGLNGERILLSHEPDYMIKTPQGLTKIFGEKK